MSKLRRWAGVGAFFFGAVLLNTNLPADMLPINRTLFAVNCALITVWMVLRVLHNGEGPR